MTAPNSVDERGRVDAAAHARPLIRPFAAIRPVAHRAGEVAAPPYDVLSVAEARERARDNPCSFLHVSRPEIDLPSDIDPYAPEVYARAALNMRRMLQGGVLVRDAAPAYYVYRIENGDHVQTGLVFAASLAAYEAGRIRRHELTRSAKEEDRARQIGAVDAQTGPVMLVHRTDPVLAATLSRTASARPDLDVTQREGVHHALWAVRDGDQIERLTETFEAKAALYIADGHHRSAAALRVAAERHAANPEHRGDEPYNYFLAVSFPEDEVRILAYNRVVKDLGGLDEDRFLAAVGESFATEPSDAVVRPDRRHVLGMYLAGRWYRLTARAVPPADGDSMAGLGVSLLTDRVLGPVLGVTDVRDDPRVDFVGGVRGLVELERRVDQGEAAVAFALQATRIEGLIAVADAGDIMPPKSTWFEPKLADGLISYPLD